jgi:lysophospholipase L1-like esterase
MSRSTAQEFFWPLDSHYNTKGYQAMGSAVADTILELGLLPGGAPPREARP